MATAGVGVTDPGPVPADGSTGDMAVAADRSPDGTASLIATSGAVVTGGTGTAVVDPVASSFDV